MMKHNVLNNQELASMYVSHRHGLTSSDEGMYMSEYDLTALAERENERKAQMTARMPGIAEDAAGRGDGDDAGMPLDNDVGGQETALLQNQYPNYTTGLAGRPPLPPPVPPPVVGALETSSRRSLLLSARTAAKDYDVDTVAEVVKNVLSRCLQPPVVGALLGIFVAAIAPLRGVFVDLVDRGSHAPLQWLFDGLYSVGNAAVPINMMILGCNLSSSANSCVKAREVSDDVVAAAAADALLPWPTMIGIVIGKMVVQPAFGILLSLVLKSYVLDIPDDIDGSFYLVLMIVFLTPTANNVMVMVELSGSGAKEGIAAVIALQYAVAPIILSLTMTVAVGIASGWS